MASISSNNTWGDVRTCAVPVVTITGTISNPDYNTVTTGTSGTYTISSKDCVCTP